MKRDMQIFPATDTTRFEAFVSPARTRPAIWRILLSVVLITLVAGLWFAAMYLGLWGALGSQAAAARMGEMVSPVTPVGTLLLLTTFVGLVIGPFLAVRLLHKRKPRTLFGPRRALLRDFALGALVTAAIYAVSLLGWSVAFDAQPNLAPALWLQLLPLGLLLVAVQTGAEEIIFRGYLMQQLAARFASRALVIGLPAILFGLLHYDPTAPVGIAALVVSSATLFGLIAADLTIRTGNIGAAWGLHFANNTVAILGLSTQGTITGLALYLTPYGIDDIDLTPGLILADLAGLVAIWAVLRWRLAR